ncbi:MAG: nitrile hydratase subunit beta [Acidimicrobiia bacterium]|nr:nitrile hydratase subunit beta [Acidimicrobiia bacterium]MXY75183.1 nitrile hydratase subunit beta [Acidimicrobiia bacterium]MYB77951.1 nitrile hydratase subunit beta [Acidimicrobiia bacterium]MYG92265.1 nitrile hydratase subunit beta [Acidimicrobiia bacterium]MYK55776.1 nitrile hydratase subunit beta [Acidimicrobiia bacterium]
MNAVHDMGGAPGEDPIDRSEHRLMEWERRTGALVDVLREKRLINTDELRRGIEAIPADEYRRLGYYERWSSSLEALLVEKELLTTQEIGRRATVVGERWG